MDDEDAIRSLAEMMLGRLGYSVEAAADGREAVEMYVRAVDAGYAFDVVDLASRMCATDSKETACSRHDPAGFAR